jgi:flagellar basal body-associated protein FliL
VVIVKKFYKLSSVILTVVLAFSVLGLTAFAVESEQGDLSPNNGMIEYINEFQEVVTNLFNYLKDFFRSVINFFRFDLGVLVPLPID